MINNRLTRKNLSVVTLLLSSFTLINVAQAAATDSGTTSTSISTSTSATSAQTRKPADDSTTSINAPHDNSDIPQPSRYIAHPDAAKGLYKIDEDRVYYYRVKLPPTNQTTTVHLGNYSPSNLVNPNDSQATFDTIYSQKNYPLILYDQEHPFFKSFGRLSWKFGTGLYVAQGKGIFAKPNAEPEGPKEEYTFLAFPFNVGLTYRLQFTQRQWLVPYAEGGGDIFAFSEFRSDLRSNGVGGGYGAAPAAHFSFGASIPLGFGARDFLDLAREYGINTMYLTAEFRDYIGLSQKYDFSGNAVTAGVTADY